MASAAEELAFKFRFICVNVIADLNSDTWLVAIVLMSAALGIHNGGEEIHVIKAVKVMLRSAPEKPTCQVLGDGCGQTPGHRRPPSWRKSSLSGVLRKRSWQEGR